MVSTTLWLMCWGWSTPSLSVLGRQEPTDKIVTFVPPDHADAVIDALRRAGAGTIGNYTGCAWKVSGTGTFTPGEGADPVIGQVGRTEVTAEARVEMLVPRSPTRSSGRSLACGSSLRGGGRRRHRACSRSQRHRSGAGRRLFLPRSPLAAFAQRVADALPSTPVGVRFLGDPQAVVARVAVCGGAGDSLLTDADRAGVDVFVTADLRHHPASEALAAGGPALVDPATGRASGPGCRWPPTGWCRRWPRAIPGATTVETHISTVVTDPVTGHVRSRPEEDR